MSSAFFRVSGVDTNDGANIVFVWCQSDGRGSHVPVGSGRVVPTGTNCPPGIRPGQFAVVVLLPRDCSADSIIVTDDKDGKRILPDITVIPCLTRTGSQPVAVAPPAGPAMRTPGAH